MPRHYLSPFAAAVFAFAAGASSAALSAEGERHPDFTLPNITDGKPMSLSDFRGKKVLLIHFASW
jgi:hypothetical protein